MRTKFFKNRLYLGGLGTGFVLGVATVLVVGMFGNSESTHTFLPLVERSGHVSESRAEGTLRYTHPERSFSLMFPKELAVHNVDEGNRSETIVFQKPGEQVGFQIFITPYSEPDITKERLELDVKGGVVDEPTEVVIGSGQRALVFWSNDPVIGRLREVWFIHGGFLYEVTTYAPLDEWLSEIMSTWEFF